MRVALEQVFILGDTHVQRAARRLVHHTWAERIEARTGKDPHPATGGKAPSERSKLARRSFYRAVRVQLRVPNAEDWADALSEVPERVEELTS